MLVRLRLLLGALLVTLMLVGCADAAADDAGTSAAAVTDPAAVGGSVAALEDAIEKKEEIDARLARALGRVGSMLTPEEQRDFVRGFNQQPDVAAVETDYHTRAATLAAQLDEIAATSMAVDQYGGRRLFDGYVLLAKTPSAPSALKFATRVIGGSLVLDGVSANDVVEKVLGPALAPAFVANLLAKGTVEEAVAETVSPLSVSKGVCLKAASWLQRYKALDTHDIVDDAIGISTASVVQSLRAIAGVIAIWQIGSDLVSGDVNAALMTFLSSGPNAVSGIAEATSLFRRVMLGIEKTPLADQVIKWSGKVATGIGLVMNVIKLWNDAGNWNDSLDAKARVIGDLVSIGASVLVLAGASGGVGFVVGTIALGIHLFADWLEDQRLAAIERNDLATCLPAAGIDAKLTEAMIESSPVLIRTLAKDVKLAPADIQWMLRTDAMAVSEKSYTTIRFIGVQVAQVIFDLDGAETSAMLRAAVGTEADPLKAEYKLDMFLRGLEFGTGWNGDLTKAQGIDWLVSEANSPYVRDGEEKTLRAAAFMDASKYLQTR